MLVILKEDLKGKGKAGDTVKVKDGYARNMLIPKGIAVEATDRNLKMLKKEQAVREAKIAEETEAAQKLAEKLKKIEVKIKAKAGEDGKLFGSITNIEIANELKERFDIDIDKKKIDMPSPIKEMGKHQVEVKLYTDVQGVINVNVIEE